MKIKLKKFDTKFLGENWKIEEDNKMSTLDLSDITLINTLKVSEKYISGEQNLERLKNQNTISLNANAFRYFWENQDKMPKDWSEKVDGNILFIYFWGTIFRDPDGNRFVLCLSRFEGWWYWLTPWLGYDWDRSDPSVALASSLTSETKPFLDTLPLALPDTLTINNIHYKRIE
jgi:hypothetical protein